MSIVATRILNNASATIKNSLNVEVDLSGFLATVDRKAMGWRNSVSLASLIISSAAAAVQCWISDRENGRYDSLDQAINAYIESSLADWSGKDWAQDVTVSVAQLNDEVSRMIATLANTKQDNKGKTTMFTINSYVDVITIARTFGKQALDHVVEYHTISEEAERLIKECKEWASCGTVSIMNFNDGNNEFSINAEYKSYLICGEMMTALGDIKIVRSGFGAGSYTVREAMEKGEITKEQLADLQGTIRARNEAATYLF